jgi:hypothetical protein
MTAMNTPPPNPVSRRTWSCPDEARLAAYFERRLEGSQQKEVEAHVANCEHCLAQVAFLLEIQDAELPTVPPALLERVRQPASERSSWAALVWKWSPAVAVVAGVVVIASVLMMRETPVPQVASEAPAARQQATEPVAAAPSPVTTETAANPPVRATRSPTWSSPEPRLLEPKPGATVDAANLELRWAAIPQALFYDVRITDPSGQLVWSSKVEGERVQVPAGAGLKPGPYFVWVRAHLPESKLVRTQAVSFTVR